jgi:GR25 family glycosyltransferase involved in LPS biosynthesis
MTLLSPDLIYYCGQSIPWNPLSKDLGGSEQAVVELSRHWAGTGLRVEVYGSIPEVMVCDGVTFFPLKQAKATLQADVIVLWRLYGLIGFWQDQQRFQCRLLAVDFHDCELFGHESRLHQSLDRIRAMMFKSKFHTDYLLGKLPSEQQLPLRQRVRVIPNGIRKKDFSLSDPPIREPHRFCYASCYLRGLVPLIQFFWPSVRQLWPDAELHVYYGMAQVRDVAVREGINRLLQSEGVHDHGRQPVSVISEEKHRSSFHLYYTNSVTETDCISIKESAVAGCIPIISGVNVFAERSGVVMPGSASCEQDFRQAAQAFVRWAQQITESELEQIRQSLSQVTTHRDWQETAVLWGRAFELVAPSLSWEQMGKVARQVMGSPGATQTSEGAKSGTNSTSAYHLASIQYINLPANVERDRSMYEQLAGSFPAEQIQRFAAVVGKTHPFSVDEKELFRNSNFRHSPFALNIMGNALSHYKIWKSATELEDNQCVVVLQDDAILDSHFKECLDSIRSEMPSGATFIMLSDHEHALLETFIPVDLKAQDPEARKGLLKEIISPSIGVRSDTWAGHCSLAYLVTASGARRVVAYTQENGFKHATDFHILNFLLSQDKNYASIRCLATSSSDLFASDIWKFKTE